MSEQSPDLRQNTLIWWGMRSALPIGVLGAISLFLTVPMLHLLDVGSTLAPLEYMGLLVIVVWLGVVFLGVLAGLGWAGLMTWERLILPWVTRSQRNRYRGLTGEEPTLPANAWSVEEE